MIKKNDLSAPCFLLLISSCLTLVAKRWFFPDKIKKDHTKGGVYLSPIQFSEITEKEYQVFEANSTNFFQTTAMANFMAVRGYDCFYFAIKENQTLKAAGIVLGQHVILGNHFKLIFGPIFEGKSFDKRYFIHFLSRLKKWVNQHACITLSVYPPIIHQIYNETGTIMTEYESSISLQMEKLAFQYSGVHKGYATMKVAPEWQF